MKQTLSVCSAILLGLAGCANREHAPPVQHTDAPTVLRSPDACPRCGTTNRLPIIYGVLNQRGMRAVRDGKAWPGDCEFSPDAPNWLCRDCGQRWRQAEVREEPAAAPVDREGNR